MPGVFQFSQTANLNSSAVPTVNYAEGQAPSSLNDSARAVMAAVACYRDDISGSLVTTGTGQNYQISATNQGFDTLVNFNNKVIAFQPHLTQTGSPVTLSVDGFANVPLRSAPNTELPIGTLIKGTPYTAIYNQADNALYLQGFYGPSPSLIPLGGTVIWWDDVLPSSNWAWANGQTIAVATVSSVLLARWGNRFGGDGVTTMGLPDMRATVPVGRPTMGGTANRGGIIVDSAPNTMFGEATHVLSGTEMPSHTHLMFLTDPGHNHTITLLGPHETMARQL
jgi:microcystin-dependent protein